VVIGHGEASTPQLRVDMRVIGCIPTDLCLKQDALFMTNTIKINRFWCMPTVWTFAMAPVQELFARYDVGKDWADPFAGKNSPAEYTNDIEQTDAWSHEDALEFLKAQPDCCVKGVLFDPPYSVEQCLRRYTPKQGGTAGRAEYWGQCKNEIARIIEPDGLAISFCWDSQGIGKKRGFIIEEIMLLCHGACHNDTIVTVDRKIGKP